jgi:hypothetical protein
MRKRNCWSRSSAVSGSPLEEGSANARATLAARRQRFAKIAGISEDPGMKLCAEWLKTFIQDVPIEWIPAGEPFVKRQ